MPRLHLVGAAVLTGDAAGTVFETGHVVIADGRIAAVGPGAPPPDTGAATVDASGLVAIPGLVNCHGHAWLTLPRGLSDDAALFEWAELNAPTLRLLTPDHFSGGSEIACFAMAHAGITTTVEACRYDPGIFAAAAMSVGIRCLVGGLARGPSPDPSLRPNWPSLVAETEAAQGRFGADPRCRFFIGAHSPYSCPPDLLDDVRREADRLALPLGIHLAETAREDALIRERHGMSPARYVDAHGWLTPRTLAAHAVHLNADDVALLAARGTAVAHCPVSNAKLASGIAPVPTLRAAGVAVGLGTDSVLSNNRLDLFAEMRAAALLQRASTQRADVLTTADVFRMATLDAARAIGWGGELGSLEPGKRADVVLLDVEHPLGLTAQRALSDVVWSAGPESVRDVMVEGRWIVRDRVLTQVDEHARREEIRRRLGGRAA
jgi:5-methylthioadenosine/S-adenosylhomocysteine deaminase